MRTIHKVKTRSYGKFILDQTSSNVRIYGDKLYMADLPKNCGCPGSVRDTKHD
jgi:translation initiation factor 1 (eIF-1/SUI1)